MNTSLSAFITESKNLFGSYCMVECSAKCCKHGALFLSQTQAEKITINKIELNIKLNILTKRNDGSYNLNLETSCPSLTSENKCNINNSLERPQMCKDFPLFPRGDSLFISSFCPLTLTKEFIKSTDELKKLGITIINQ